MRHFHERTGVRRRLPFEPDAEGSDFRYYFDPSGSGRMKSPALVHLLGRMRQAEDRRECANTLAGRVKSPSVTTART